MFTGEANIAVGYWSTWPGLGIDFSAPLDTDAYNWVSKLSATSSYVPFFDGFDAYTWALILASMLAVSVALFLPYHVRGKKNYADKTLMLLTPVALLMAEDLPKWFSAGQYKRGQKKNFNSISGNFTLLTRCMMGSVIAYAFHGNLRAMYIKKLPAKQINFAKDIVEQKKQVYVYKESSLKDYFLSQENDNEMHHVIGLMVKDFIEEDVDALFMSILSTGEKVIVFTKRDVENTMFNNGMKMPGLHFGKERITPSYRVWLLEKNSPWKDSIDKHIWALSQVITIVF